MTTAHEHPHSVPEISELPSEVATAAAPAPRANRAETLRRGAHQGRLQGYAIAIVASLAVLIALAATNTARVNVDRLVGSSQLSLGWLVLAAAIIGWILGGHVQSAIPVAYSAPAAPSSI